MWVTSSLSNVQTPTVIALGNFDGVHRGHQAVIHPILAWAEPDSESALFRSLAADLKGCPELASIRGYSDRSPALLSDSAPPPAGGLATETRPIPTVVTFYPHPREFFTQQTRPWLTPLDEKAAFLKVMGARQLVLLPFNQELANLSPEEFVDSILVRRLQAKHISVGADFRFGRQRAGTVEQLQALAARHDIRVTVVSLAQDHGDRISSSRIRQALNTGDLTTARQLLGRSYCVTGRVVQGQQLGRQIGFPTANIQVSEDKFLPRMGVYSAWVYGVPGQNQREAVPGVLNLGLRPTVDGQTQSLEVHLLNWQGELYGQRLTLTLEEFLRPEIRFDSLEALKTQIQTDCERASATLSLGDRASVGA